MSAFRTGDLVTFAPREGETAEGIVTRYWAKPEHDRYVTIKTADGRTFVRLSSQVRWA